MRTRLRRPLPPSAPSLLLLAAATALGAAGAACGDPGPGAEGAAPTVTLETDGEAGKADAAGELKVQVPGMTLWFRPVLRYDEAADRFLLLGRASKDVAEVRPFVPDDAFGTARVVSARKFEISFDDHELNSLLSGLRLFLPVVPRGAAEPTHTAMIELGPRFGASAGSSLIYVHRVIKPVRVGDELVYRGRATVDPRLGEVAATNDDDSEPTVTKGSDGYHHFDWPFWALELSASPTEDALRFRGTLPSGETVTRTAQIHFTVTRLGLTGQRWDQAWPERTCERAVRACLDALPAGTLDTEPCGTWTKVNRCGWSAPAPAVEKPALEVVLKDLRTAVVRYSVDHREDIAAAGGRDGYEAQMALGVSQISEVTDPAEDPEGHDLERFWVFSHPDTIFPGSDIVWYAAYGRSTGALERVYPFN